ncbi:MFS transporter, partial [Acidovorax sp. ST3]|uniref:MFS transporter n=1 Tax=Acidovorax sp. ST3 TaxID=2219062 RepID=UPI001EEFDD15
MTLCSFTTYALSHNIGGSVFSGAVIRYRAYATRGLSGQEVGVLVAVCWITFVLSSILLGGIVLILIPDLFERFADVSAFKEVGYGGLSAGAGIVVGQAIIRDCYDGAVARRAMSYLILVFNLSPALAPILGGYLAAHQGWRSVFLLLTALAGAAWLLCARRLP